MRNNPLDDIIKCNVEFAEPAMSDFPILLVVPAPESTGIKTMTKATAIYAADDLLEYGFTEESAAYRAVSVAFAQSPAPDAIYVKVRGTYETTTEYYIQVEEGTEGALKAIGNSTNPKEGEIRRGDATPTSPEDYVPAIGDYVKLVTETTTHNEPIETTLANTVAEVGFYGIHLTGFRSSEDIQAAAAWTEANEKLFGFEYTDINACPVTNFSYYRTFGVFSGLADDHEADDQPAENEFAALALMAKCFSFDPGTETWHLKELNKIVPSALSPEQKTTLGQLHINTFLRYAGSNVTIGGYVLSGEWIDVIRFRDWLKVTMQTRVFEVLKNNRKVPFSDAGIALIQGAMISALADGQRIGGIAEDSTDSNGNSLPGYTTTVPLASNLTERERKSRKLTGCKYTARLAGAIHVVEIEGTLTF